MEVLTVNVNFFKHLEGLEPSERFELDEMSEDKRW